MYPKDSAQTSRDRSKKFASTLGPKMIAGCHQFAASDDLLGPRRTLQRSTSEPCKRDPVFIEARKEVVCPINPQTVRSSRRINQSFPPFLEPLRTSASLTILISAVPRRAEPFVSDIRGRHLDVDSISESEKSSGSSSMSASSFVASLNRRPRSVSNTNPSTRGRGHSPAQRGVSPGGLSGSSYGPSAPVASPLIQFFSKVMDLTILPLDMKSPFMHPPDLEQGTLDDAIKIALFALPKKNKLESLLLTHRHFNIPSPDLLKKFLTLLNCPESEASKYIRVRAMYAICLWKSKVPRDFKTLDTKLKKHTAKLKNADRFSQALAKAVEMAHQEGLKFKRFQDHTHDQLKTAAIKKNTASFLDFRPTQIADAITWSDFLRQVSVPHTELLFSNFSKPKTCPALTSISNQFNKMTQWIGNEIIQSKKRPKIIALFIAVTHKLLKMGNFGGFLTFFLGLSQGAVSCLPEWKQMPTRDHERYKSFQLVSTPTGNFRVLRQRLALCEGPHILSPMLFLRDLTMLGEIPDFENPKDKTQISFNKLWALGDVIQSVVLSQTRSYSIVPSPICTAYILGSVARTEVIPD